MPEACNAGCIQIVTRLNANTRETMGKTNLPKSNNRPEYKKPELVSYGNLSAITKASSGGSIPDGANKPNMNVTMA